MAGLQAHSNGPVFDDEVLADAEVKEAIEQGKSVHREYDIYNTDRAAFGRVGGAVARIHGDFNFPAKLSFDLRVSVCRRATHLGPSWPTLLARPPVCLWPLCTASQPMLLAHVSTSSSAAKA